MQYLASALPVGDGIGGFGSGIAAKTGEVAMAMLKATNNPLRAMSFLLEGNLGMPFQYQNSAAMPSGTLPPLVEKRGPPMAPRCVWRGVG